MDSYDPERWLHARTEGELCSLNGWFSLFVTVAAAGGRARNEKDEVPASSGEGLSNGADKRTWRRNVVVRRATYTQRPNE